jgi:hypothetical protein
MVKHQSRDAFRTLTRKSDPRPAMCECHSDDKLLNQKACLPLNSRPVKLQTESIDTCIACRCIIKSSDTESS